MEHFDIAVVGAGPAGCHCGRILAKAGYRVLLVEQHENFDRNNFSSAATPLETLEQFDLPDEVVASFWKEIAIVTTNVSRNWQSPTSLGVVFDFAKLREFLAQEVRENGSEVWMGCRYLNYVREADKNLVTLKKRDGDRVTINTRILVDATGFSRAVMYPNKKDKPKFLKGTGIEYLIEVEKSEYRKYADSLIFFMGYQWSPKGYSWIFPMDSDRLKVGAAWLEGKHKFIDEVKPLKAYIHQIIAEYMKLSDYKLIDVHGSILEYSIGLKDVYCKENIIAIGDAVSTVNFLGGEGIRHGMKGAEIACQYIEDYLENKIQNFNAYQKEMQQYFAKKWNLSEQISRRVFLEYSDRNIDRGVAYLKYLATEDIVNVLFYYNFDKVTKGFNRYLFKKLDTWLQAIKNFLGLS